MAISIVAGRTGNAVQITATTSALTYSIPVLYRSTTMTVGFAFQIPVVTSGVRQLAFFRSGGNNAGSICVDSTGTSFFVTSATGASVGPNGGSITIGTTTWYYVEVKYFMHDTNASCVAKLNGTEIINVSGFDGTPTGGVGVYDALKLGPPNASTGGTTLYDDLYISNGPSFPFKGSIALT